MKNLKHLLIIAAMASFVGCSSTKEEIIAEKNAETLKEIPEWYLTPPDSNEIGLYGVGTSASQSLQQSVSQSQMHASVMLAKMLSQELVARERSYTSDGSGYETKSESVVSNLVVASDLTGIDTVKRTVNKIGNKFHVYTLVSLSFEEQAKLLARKKNTAVDSRAQAAFESLEADVLKRIDKE